MEINKVIKIALSILLLLCLLNMPYGYYSLVRFLSMGVFLYFAFETYKDYPNNLRFILFYILLALLFQPFLKIPLGRTIWNIVDVVVAGGLLYSVFGKNK